ncbi:efflux RND transporter periplasmic adaptor subunit [Pseudomarimonas arenosa]|uniref:Efflux RND transporter periplasmic adaptor subunit n=1 Tax=Pseudomarimonas arenosa TaxID=2774145 RepID=A0AAW3ZJM0_9GAMM|nr:efflux RND transporter periplasmic adaptor subunit [Pseudomarimonas arenosa]MBD8524909.1 efflux RND transporter periplasmic adaptor subunit [Pseudomarimonas arenosa]
MARRSSQFSLLSMALILSGSLLLAACSPQDDAESRPRPALVVKPQPVQSRFAVFPGEVHARTESALSFRVGGKLATRHVDMGDRVVKGQVLAELDPDDLKLQAGSARAQLAAAEADLALARNERDRHKSLLDRQLISESLFDARESQFQAALARREQAKAQVDVAQNQASYAKLRADRDGVIAQRNAEAGQVVAAGQPVFVLAADGEREISISLPEFGIDNYKVGQPVLISLWSKPDQRIAGRLHELSPAADAGARTYAARVEIEGDSSGIELGQSARAIFALNGAQALAVPLPAVTADAGRHYVWVVNPDTSTVHRREVQISAFLDEQVPVTSGIEAGDWVVAAGVHLLQEGQPVRPVDYDNRPLQADPSADAPAG